MSDAFFRATRPPRILVYSVHAGRDAGGDANLGRVARVIDEARAGPTSPGASFMRWWTPRGVRSTS